MWTEHMFVTWRCISERTRANKSSPQPTTIHTYSSLFFVVVVFVLLLLFFFFFFFFFFFVLFCFCFCFLFFFFVCFLFCFFLLTVPRRFLCCSSSLFLHRWSHFVEFVLSLYFLLITKTRLFKYIENFATKTGKFSDKKFRYFSYFCSKHRLWVLVRTASPRRF